ncbi:MAG: hypothetical protein M1818_002832 [Claussenomyces sp. TS43310]|nr:MAG: hypothetical protein M1818_002832 [Claussenomyces sp. TS43310]
MTGAGGSQGTTESGSSSVQISESSTDSSPRLLPPSILASGPQEKGWPPLPSGADEGDDSSDASMSADTDDSDDDDGDDSRTTSRIIVQQTVANILDPGDVSLDLSRKRKLQSESEETYSDMTESSANLDHNKRIRSEGGLQGHRITKGFAGTDKSLLPAEIWHHIFTFTPPKSLSRLLQVNKVFNAYLDPLSCAPTPDIPPLSGSAVPLRTPEVIWQASRRLFRPGMPSPLRGVSELAMWKLACNTVCQYCNRKPQVHAVSADPWHSGPGETGVRPVWPFGEIDLLLSPSVPSPLLAALPFAFLTDDFHLIPANTLQQGPPPNISIAKYFFKSGVEDIQQEFCKVKGLGSGTAEEWLKGLDGTGRSIRADASRWERWEAGGGLQRMRGSDETDTREATSQTGNFASLANSAQHLDLKATTSNKSSVYQTARKEGIPAKVFFPQPIQATASYPATASPRFNNAAQSAFSTYSSQSIQAPRQERTKEEVSELKAARKAEIERRCMQLDPPLTPGVLAHMASFQAAIQIIKPFDHDAWELLKPRLLSQRDEAEQHEAERIAQTRAIQEKFDERRQQDSQVKEPKDVIDREWEDAQAPLRARIAGFADEIIREGWNNGDRVTKENSPKFAADVLLYVRRRFYAEVAKDNAAALAVGQEPKCDPPNGPFTQKLVLENMKWVYDTKVKPHTEQHRKDFFLCNGCENNFKFYGFEGVIQHYAAKHTSALSVGSIVVHWRAEWPEHPPFKPDPVVGKGTNHQSIPPTTVALASSQSVGFGSHPSISAPPGIVQSAAGPQNPASFYSHPQNVGQYVGFPLAQFASSSNYPTQSHEYSSRHYQASPATAFQQYQGQGHMPHGYKNPYPGPASTTYDPGHSGEFYPADFAGQCYANAKQPSQDLPTSGVHRGSAGYSAGLQTTGIIRTEEYKAKLLDVARAARDIWNNTAGVKDMPGSVRVYVTLFHILKVYRAKHPEDPPLTMLIDGLTNNKDMRPVRNVNGLACRACILEKALRGNQPYTRTTKGTTEKKLFSLPQLLNHFQATHIAPFQGSPQYDWTTDMVELPDKKKKMALARASGIDDHKLKLISEALPHLFAPFPPEPERSESVPPYQHHGEAQDSQGHYGLAPSQDHHDKYYKPNSQIRPGLSNREYDRRTELHDTPSAQNSPLTIPISANRYIEEAPREDHDNTSLTHFDHRARSPQLESRNGDGPRRFVPRDSKQLYSDNNSRHHEVNRTNNHSQRHRGPDEGPYSDLRRTPKPRPYQREPSPISIIEVNGRQLARKGETRTRGIYAESYSNGLNQRNEGNSQPGSLAQSPYSQPRSRFDPIDGGSEDGEVRIQTFPRSEPMVGASYVEAGSAAERFLNEFVPGESAEDYARKAEDAARRDEASRAKWNYERIDHIDRAYRYQAGRPSRGHQFLADEDHLSGRQMIGHDTLPSSFAEYGVEDKYPQDQHRGLPYEYDNRYATSAVDSPNIRLRTQEALDYRYEPSNVVYLEERHSRTSSKPPRATTYDDTREIRERQRSRSPIFINASGKQSRYRDFSPGVRYAQPEPSYRTRSPQAPLDQVAYERVPRHEYYRVYAEEPSLRSSHYGDQVQYVQVSDRADDYVIRQPLPQDPEAVYRPYGDEPDNGPVVFETRAPISRSDPAYYEEYDPRNPAPPPATARQIRYQ